jgi:hypothetical protein
MRIYLENCCSNRPYDDQAQSKMEVESSDYTEWRRTNLFPDMSVEEISKQAMAYRNAKRHEE